MIDLKRVCEQVRGLTSEVASFLRTELHNFDIDNIEKKGQNDLVSYVDRSAEEKIVTKLKEILPESAFFTEEDKESHKLTNKDYHWIIDPLDGTTNFLHGLPIFAISIALMHREEVVLGVVHEVNRDECFYAWKDGGAYCNAKRIQVSPIGELSESLLATGFPYRDFDQIPAYLDIVKDFMQKTHGLRRMGSAAVDLAYVAIGRFEGFFEYNLNAWDVAAGGFIIQEAGGSVTTFRGGRNFVFGKEIVAGCAVQQQMLEVIKSHWVKP